MQSKVELLGAAVDRWMSKGDFALSFPSSETLGHCVTVCQFTVKLVAHMDALYAPFADHLFIHNGRNDRTQTMVRATKRARGHADREVNCCLQDSVIEAAVAQGGMPSPDKRCVSFSYPFSLGMWLTSSSPAMVTIWSEALVSVARLVEGKVPMWTPWPPSLLPCSVIPLRLAWVLATSFSSSRSPIVMLAFGRSSILRVRPSLRLHVVVVMVVALVEVRAPAPAFPASTYRMDRVSPVREFSALGSVSVIGGPILCACV